MNEQWKGLSPKATEALQKCSTRKVQLVVKGRTSDLTLNLFLEPGAGLIVPGQPPSSPQTSEQQQRLARLGVPETTPLNSVSTFRLKEVLYDSNLLLTSSDITRVKVTRNDSSTKEKKGMVLNLEQTDPKTDLWLRDGDVIEVPEKE